MESRLKDAHTVGDFMVDAKKVRENIARMTNKVSSVTSGRAQPHKHCRICFTYQTQRNTFVKTKSVLTKMNGREEPETNAYLDVYLFEFSHLALWAQSYFGYSKSDSVL